MVENNPTVQIEVKGLDKVLAAFDRFPNEIDKYITQAGYESAERIVLPTQGLRTYPPMTSANQPPTPYYIRGRGMQYKYGNDMKSENLGKV